MPDTNSTQAATVVHNRIPFSIFIFAFFLSVYSYKTRNLELRDNVQVYVVMSTAFPFEVGFLLGGTSYMAYLFSLRSSICRRLLSLICILCILS